MFPYVFLDFLQGKNSYWKGKLMSTNIIFPYELWILYKVGNFNSMKWATLVALKFLFLKENKFGSFVLQGIFNFKGYQVCNIIFFLDSTTSAQQVQLFYKGSITMFFANEYVVAIQLS